MYLQSVKGLGFTVGLEAKLRDIGLSGSLLHGRLGHWSNGTILGRDARSVVTWAGGCRWLFIVSRFRVWGLELQQFRVRGFSV